MLISGLRNLLMPLNLIEPRRLYQAVADQIAELIRTEEYRPGDRLPNERELVRQLGVSRSVVREAMIALEIGGLVEVRSGSGIYVCGLPLSVQSSAADLAEIGPFDIFDARVAVEGETAAVAAEHATVADLAEMAEAIEHMRLAAQAGRPTKPTNQRFHLAVAVAARNPMLLKINQMIWAELPKRGPIWEKLDARRHFRPTRMTEHELILRAITERNPEHARAAARAHLQATIKDYLQDAAADPAEPEALPVQKSEC
jgi:GntR family transcriptional regulator, transcriptional repressor for pyruvate dehydrogenase complex